jgi:hypothetical protein
MLSEYSHKLLIIIIIIIIIIKIGLLQPKTKIRNIKKNIIII